ncbi:MAG: sulfatase-like hydrolase/transferase, partial [Planctomycetes bacterium]|nr:sulfatase-like hydrolase/transferase [Planctomycetota bacterium]
LRSLHGYYACVSYADAQIGRILNTLKKENLEDSTIVCLVGDNGYHNGNNGVWAKGVNWESTNHVPLIFRIPGLNKKNDKCTAIVEALDIYPSLCHAAGIPTPLHCEGKSLIPLIQNHNTPWSDIALHQHFSNKRIMGKSIRTDRYRYTIYSKNNQKLGVELYDYLKDPMGNHNYADNPEYKSIHSELLSRHKKHWEN